jgi:hypothetical protein
MDAPADVRSPEDFHPAFFGCFDWHSSVHGHWMLVRLVRVVPDFASAGEIRSRLEAHFSPDTIAGEASYMDRVSARSFERPYGWAWTLRLAAELEGWDDPQGKMAREHPPARKQSRRAAHGLPQEADEPDRTEFTPTSRSRSRKR